MDYVIIKYSILDEYCRQIEVTRQVLEYKESMIKDFRTRLLSNGWVRGSSSVENYIEFYQKDYEEHITIDFNYFDFPENALLRVDNIKYLYNR